MTAYQIKRKALSMILTIAMLMTVVQAGGIAAFAADSDTFTADSGGVIFKYEVISEANKTVQVISNTATTYSGILTIPESVQGSGGVTYSVIKIGDAAFTSRYNVTAVNIPSSVTSIGNNTFQLCSKLASVVIPSDVTSIGDYAFQGTNLADISLPDNVKIGQNSFVQCKFQSIMIPKGASIGKYAFSGSKSLKSVTMGDGAIIDDYAFSSCAALADFKINGSVSFGNGVFSETGFTSVTIPSSFTSFGAGVFNSCASLESVTIADGVKEISPNEFISCRKLKSISIPDSLASISSVAFAYCAALESVSIPSNVSSIGINAFYGCTGLTSVTFKGTSKLTSIGDTAFDTCTALNNVHIPASVTKIGKSSFQNCSSLTNITFEGAVPTSVGTDVFKTTNTTSYPMKYPILGHVPYGTANAYTTRFSSDTSTSRIAFGIQEVGTEFNDGCLKYKVLSNVPNTCTVVGYLTLPTGGKVDVGITAICGDAKYGITAIADNAFSNCAGLTSITIPAGVVGIGNSAFTGCSNLTDVTFKSSAPPTMIGSTIFASDDKLTNIWVPTTSEESTFKAKQGLSDYVDKIKGIISTLSTAEIEGVSVPKTGETPVSNRVETTEYAAAISWAPNDTTFKANTAYTATITLSPKTGYTLTGITKNFFKVAGAATVTNAAESGVVTAVFPATAETISTKAIAGVTAPSTAAMPVSSIAETDEYTAAISWTPNDTTFKGNTAYTATITLTPKTGYTLTGITKNFFKVAGAATVTNAADSGVVTAVFPATAAPITAVVTSVAATNGTVSIALDKVPSVAPVASDFTVTSTIGSDSLSLSSFAWDASSKAVTFSFTPFAQTALSQTVIIAVSYKGAVPITAPAFTLTAASGGDSEKATITGFKPLDDTLKSYTVDNGVDFSSLNLTKKLEVVGKDITGLFVKVTKWVCSTYDATVAGVYKLTPVLDSGYVANGYVDSGYVIGSGVSRPQITVMVKEKSSSSDNTNSNHHSSVTSSSAPSTKDTTETKVGTTGNTVTVTTKPDSVTTSGNTTDMQVTVPSVTTDNTQTSTNGNTTDTTKKTAVTINVPTQNIVQQLAAKKDVDLTITVPSDVAKDANANIAVTINANKEVLQAAKDNLSDVTINIKDADTQQLAYSWTFKGADLAKSTVPVTDVNIAMSVHLTTEVPKVNVITPNNKGLVLSFDHSGLLPSVASVKFSALEKGFKPGETLYFYYYNPTTKQIESLGKDAYTVGADGYVTVQIYHCSDYVLLPNAARSITLDTRTYTMASKKSYEIGVKLTNASDTTIKAYSSTEGVANVTILKNENVKVTGAKVGLTYIMIDVYDKKNKFLTHASVRVTVQKGVKQNGNSARQYGIF